MSRLDSLLNLVRFTHAFRQVERGTIIAGRRENDAEHSFQLALAAWYLACTEKLPLDIGKVLRYALAHDLVERYAGDVPAYNRSPQADALKREREREALARIEQEFLEFPQLSASIHAYERREDPEARFVYAVDKLLPMANNYLAGGVAWKTSRVTLAMLRDVKDRTIAASSEVYVYWEALRAVLEVNESDLFHVPGAGPTTPGPHPKERS